MRGRTPYHNGDLEEIVTMRRDDSHRIKQLCGHRNLGNRKYLATKYPMHSALRDRNQDFCRPIVARKYDVGGMCVAAIPYFLYSEIGHRQWG